MQVARTAPYLEAPDEAVAATPWMLVLENEEVGLSDAIPAWDPAMDLRFRRSVVIRPDLIWTSCRLPAGSALVVASSWETGTRLRDRGSASRLEKADGTPATVVSEVSVMGELLSANLRLTTSVVLAVDLPRAPLQAFRAGTVLWEDKTRLLLEGGGSRFPMEAIPFSRSLGFPSRAAWYLDWDVTDLEVPVLGGVRLYLNLDHQVIARTVRETGDPRSRVVIEAIQFDVARQLIRGALSQPDFVARDTPYPKESIGRIIQRLLKTRFRGERPTGLRAEMQEDPDRFDARLQHELALFGAEP
jgi:hypothetical protein